MSHHSPARSEAKENNETIRTLKAENRRLRKQLKEALRNPPENDSSADEDLPKPIPQRVPRPKSHPLSCPCSRENPESVKTVDLFSHTLYFCPTCNSRKSIRKVEL